MSPAAEETAIARDFRYNNVMTPIREDRPSISTPQPILPVADWFAFTLLSSTVCELARGRGLQESFLVATALAVVGLAVWRVYRRSSGREDVLGWIATPFVLVLSDSVAMSGGPQPDLPAVLDPIAYLILLLPTAWLIGRLERRFSKTMAGGDPIEHPDGFAGDGI